MYGAKLSIIVPVAAIDLLSLYRRKARIIRDDSAVGEMTVM